MATGARVENIEALKTLKITLVKCAQKIQAGLEDAESELQQTLNWLETEQPTYWAGQLRKRHEVLERAKEALRMKKLFKDATGRTPSAVDEERAVAVAKRRMEEAEQKAIATKKWAGRLQKEVLLYKGQVMRMVTACSTDIPAAAAQLNNIILKLDEYMAVGPVETTSSAEGRGPGGMTRAAGAAVATDGPSPYAALRQQTPAALIREATRIIDVGEIQWQSGTVMAQDLEQLLSLDLSREPADPAERLICAPEVWTSPAVYFERLARLPDGSGWYCGPADATAPPAECVAIRLADVVRIRPDLNDVFALPEGFMVVIGAALGIQAVLNPQNKDVFPRPARDSSGGGTTAAG